MATGCFFFFFSRKRRGRKEAGCMGRVKERQARERVKTEVEIGKQENKVEIRR